MSYTYLKRASKVCLFISIFFKNTDVINFIGSIAGGFTPSERRQKEIHWKGIQTISLSTLFLEKERTSLEHELQRRLGFLG